MKTNKLQVLHQQLTDIHGEDKADKILEEIIQENADKIRSAVLDNDYQLAFGFAIHDILELDLRHEANLAQEQHDWESAQEKKAGGDL